MREWAPLVSIIALFCLFCVLFNLSTPYRTAGRLVHQRAESRDIGAPDERQHANYVRFVAERHSFPVLRPGDPDLYENYQAHQPPAYYILAAVWSGGRVESAGDGFWLRTLNTFIGVLTLLGLFFGALWVFCDRTLAAAATSLGLAPMSIALHSAVSNDPLLICLCTWVMAWLGRVLKDGWTGKSAVAVGVLAGAALLTKTTAVTLLPCILGVALVRGKAQRIQSLIAFSLPLILVLPWWLRNISLYGDPLAAKVFLAAFTGSPQASMFIEEFGPVAYWSQFVAWWTARSAIGVFGYMDIFMFETLSMEKSNSLYVAILFIMSLPLCAGLVQIVRRRSELKWPGTLWALFSVMVTVLFVRFNMQYFQGQARYLYPALAPVSWTVALGATALLKSKPGWAFACLLLILTTLDCAAWVQLGPAFGLRTPYQ